MKKLLGAALAASLTACASSTVIDTVPNGATVYLNGMRVGTTPFQYTDTKIVGAKNNLLLKKEGYEDQVASFSRTESFNAAAFIGGLLVYVPFLWVMDYQPLHSYELTPLKSTAASTP